MGQRIAFIVLLLPLGWGAAEEPATRPAPWLAVVQVPSHGGSATVIATLPPRAGAPDGVTFLLTAAHLLDGGGSSRPVVIVAPAPEGAAPRVTARPRFIAHDRRRDLALLRMEAGPLPFVAPVAPPGTAVPPRLLACGYDHMVRPARAEAAVVLRLTALEIQTREKPNPGRSGGGLFDPATGRLVGVCLARVDEIPGPGGYGVYASLDAVHAFLAGAGHGWLIPGGAPAPRPAPRGPT